MEDEDLIVVAVQALTDDWHVHVDRPYILLHSDDGTECVGIPWGLALEIAKTVDLQMQVEELEIFGE